MQFMDDIEHIISLNIILLRLVLVVMILNISYQYPSITSCLGRLIN